MDRIYNGLIEGCLCSVDIQPIIDFVSGDANSPSARDECLHGLTILQELCDVTDRFASRRNICSTIASFFDNTLVKHRKRLWENILFKKLRSDDRFIRYSTRKLLNRVVKFIDEDEYQQFLTKGLLSSTIVSTSSSVCTTTASINLFCSVLGDILKIEMPLREIGGSHQRRVYEDNDDRDCSLECYRPIKVPNNQQYLKTLVVNMLSEEMVNVLNFLVKQQPKDLDCTITFLSSWESIIDWLDSEHQFNGRSIFYGRLDADVRLLAGTTSSQIILVHILNVVSKSLKFRIKRHRLQNYGDKSEQSSNFTSDVGGYLEKDFWDCFQSSNRKCSFTGGYVKSTATIFNGSLSMNRIRRKLILVVLESLTLVMEQENRPSNVFSTIDEHLREFDRLLSAWSGATNEHCSRTIINLFMDDDNDLVECLLESLELYLGICDLEDHSSDCAFKQILDPHRMFCCFIELTGGDHQILLDLLVSNETRFLLFFVKYLKTLGRSILHSHITTNSEAVNECQPTVTSKQSHSLVHHLDEQEERKDTRRSALEPLSSSNNALLHSEATETDSGTGCFSSSYVSKTNSEDSSVCNVDAKRSYVDNNQTVSLLKSAKLSSFKLSPKEPSMASSLSFLSLASTTIDASSSLSHDHLSNSYICKSITTKDSEIPSSSGFRTDLHIIRPILANLYHIIDKLHKSNIFPYNPASLLKLLRLIIR